MSLVPKLGAKRVLLIHVHVIEPLGRHIALIFDERLVRSAEVRESRSAVWLHALRLRISDLGCSQAKHASGARPCIAAHRYGTALFSRVQRSQRDAIPLVPLERLAHVRYMPAEMPDRRLRLGCRRMIDSGE